MISKGCHRTLLAEYQAARCPTTSCFGMLSYLVQVGCPNLLPPPSLSCLLLTPPPLNHDVGDTPFEDGTFKLLLTFDESYPNKPPTVKFLSRMFHPNVYANGELCLDILQNRWSPTYDVAAILTSIQSLLHDPNPNSPANAEAAQLYRENMKEYVRRVKVTVEESWLDPEEMTEEQEGSTMEVGGGGGENVADGNSERMNV